MTRMHIRSSIHTNSPLSGSSVNESCAQDTEQKHGKHFPCLSSIFVFLFFLFLFLFFFLLFFFSFPFLFFPFLFVLLSLFFSLLSFFLFLLFFPVFLFLEWGGGRGDIGTSFFSPDFWDEKNPGRGEGDGKPTSLRTSAQTTLWHPSPFTTEVGIEDSIRLEMSIWTKLLSDDLSKDIMSFMYLSTLISDAFNCNWKKTWTQFSNLNLIYFESVILFSFICWQFTIFVIPFVT